MSLPAGLTGDLMRLRAIYSRTFGVCCVCYADYRGPRATHWTDDEDLGRIGWCDLHHLGRGRRD